ncbi:PQQ-binding-like beta-propeller repeat protein [Verrucomicrobium spinosum]|uniref:outer membrane protein assembly factor BamB family protein n=1 Tax=Verrucomicrobium spinosum TaxID=2736 RepID=UPI0009466FD4|nr:PQQ-binding-like beta-propeller repeat protein [Verrucomicrobium spinosum]
MRLLPTLVSGLAFSLLTALTTWLLNLTGRSSMARVTTTPLPRQDGTKTGRRWTTDPMEAERRPWSGLVCVVGNRAYTAGNDGADTDTIWCLDLETGKEIWKHQYPCKTAAHLMPIVPFGPAATPTVVGGLVYTLSREGDALCLNAGTGQVVWQKNLLQDFGGKRPVYGYANSVLVTCGHAFYDAGGDTGSTVCLNAKTGEPLWMVGKGEAGYSMPVFTKLGGQDVMLLYKGEALVVLEPVTGKELARHATTTRDFSNCATPFVEGSTIFVSHTGAEGSTGLDFKNNTLTPTWNERDLGLLFNSGVPWQKHLIVFNDQKRGVKDLRCVSMATGKPKWICDEIDKGTAILSDEHLIILTNAGELVLAKLLPDKLDVVQRAQVLPGKGYVLPVLSHGRLLCKNNAGDVVCLDVKPGQP